MNLPTQAQVGAGVRYATVAASTAIALLGLQAKGISLDQVKIVINALGDLINNLVIVAGAVAAAYASFKGFQSASPTAQAASVEKQGMIVIASPEIAAATPDSPNVISQEDVKVVPK